jgi:hypothetical protein
MTREESRKQQWTMWREHLEMQPTHSSAWHCGFNAAWDALLSEIGPLVDCLGHVSVTHHIPLATIREEGHNMAVERLRELVQEGE